MLWTRDIGDHLATFVASSTGSLIVYAPFIQVGALDSILQGQTFKELIVVTTWRPEDFLSGASSTGIYPYLKSKGGSLFLHPNLHLKVALQDYRRAILQSANITQRGLGLAQRPNVECGTLLEDIETEELKQLLQIVIDSQLVDDQVYEAFNGMALRTVDSPADGVCIQPSPTTGLSISSLPSIASPERLAAILSSMTSGDAPEYSELERALALKDASRYGVRLGSHSEIVDSIRAGFLSERFILELQQFISDRRFFGEVKRWIQSTTQDSPKPSCAQLTDVVQRLFVWLPALSPVAFRWARPRFSECLIRRSRDIFAA